jgi:hypothetical protein
LANRNGILKVKKMIRISATVFAAIVISACSSTPSTAPAQPDKTPPGTSTSATKSSEPTSVEELRAEMYAEEEVVCRYEKTIGSRLGKRVCRTKSQSEAERIAGQEALERNARMQDEQTRVTGE